MIEISIVRRDPTEDERRIRDLLKASTAHKDAKNFDACAACLREAYLLMEGVSTEWGYREFFRLARCLHLAGRFDEAIAHLQQLHDGLEDYYARRARLGYEAPPRSVLRNIRGMIKSEIAVTEAREKKRITAEARKRDLRR